MSPSTTEAAPQPQPWVDKHHDDLREDPKAKMPTFAKLLPTFDDKYEEREYMKHRLALAFRIFAKHGFADGVAGHITLRVRFHDAL
jgi:hypothetical protein